MDVTAAQVPLSLASSSTLSTYTFTPGNAYTLYVYGQPGSSAEPLSAAWVLDYPVQQRSTLGAAQQAVYPVFGAVHPILDAYRLP